MIYFSILLQDIMLIGLTGTPGCGKTTVAMALAERGYNVVSLNHLAKNKDCVISYDEDRDTYEVDLEKLDAHIQDELSDKDLIIEGHLAHFLTLDKLIILRCDPIELRRRLASKDWSGAKIKENVDAEIMDVIKIEAHEEDQNYFEIDTSYMEPKEVADRIEAIINGEYKYPKIDWLRKYEYLLFESP
jgi:adenylate kinase